MDTPMPDAAPSTVDGKPDPRIVVEEWTKEQVFRFIQARNLLPDVEDETLFRNAKIDGKVFLECGDDLYFWKGACGLAAAPSYRLAKLVQRIKAMDKQESQGNAFHLGSIKPANSFADDPAGPTNQFAEFLKTVKFMGKEESQGNAFHFGSV
jgi:hypothetical protein